MENGNRLTPVYWLARVWNNVYTDAWRQSQKKLRKKYWKFWKDSEMKSQFEINQAFHVQEAIADV